MARTAAKEDVLSDLPETPAKILEGHICDRETSTVAGAPRAWRVRSPLMAFYEDGRLKGGNSRYGETARYTAGCEYERLFLTAQPSSRDSTDIDRVNKSIPGISFTEAQSDAMRVLGRLHKHLGRADRAIVLSVCGFGNWPSVAIVGACGPGYEKAVSPRFREALDALIEAFEAVRRGVNSNSEMMA